MSKRRKNAGEGYGYMFHGAFAKKADAKKKERQVGGFVKASNIAGKRRYVVMSERKNPIRRKKKTKPVVESTPATNPSELMVMGANPHENLQEIVLQPGARLVIRNNPEPRENIYFGFLPARPSRADLVKSRREFRQGVSRKTKEIRAEHTRLRKSARASFRGKKKLETLFHEVYGQNPRGNPSAEALRERFTGAPVGKVQVFDEPHMPAGNYAMLGKMLALYVKPRQGGQVQQIQLPGVIAVSDESARQIYFVGGDQDISSALAVFGAIERRPGLFEIGEARRLDYRQRKEHVPHPESDSWRHDLGEETGERPLVLFDANAKRLLLEGGAYEIRPEGIVN